MNLRKLSAVVIATTVAATLSALVPAAATTARTTTSTNNAAAWTTIHHGANGEADRNVCSAPTKTTMSCLARIRLSNGSPISSLSPRIANATIGDNGAYSPAYLQSAYNLPSATAGVGKTVAIVDAYDEPNIASDLAAYRARWGLPACSVASGCFRQINEHGGSVLPGPDPGWGVETALDVEMVSAICPNCKILLVEAAGANTTDLFNAVATAANSGADAVSMSWGRFESFDETSLDSVFSGHPGVAFTASSGDYGYGPLYPAASPAVIAVGGTSLYQNSATGSRDATETAWNGSGSFCSPYEPKPAWQHDTVCSTRTYADVSAVADPATGVWVYDTYGGTAAPPNWIAVGGTSASSPIIASVAALGSAQSGGTNNVNAIPYSRAGQLNDITSGSNYYPCPNYICQAVPGYDGPTGLGTPNTTGAFVVTTPEQVTMLRAGAQSGEVSLSWQPPAENGGSDLTSYNIYDASSPGIPIATVPATSTSYTITGLSDGTTYSFSVSAVNAIGEGPVSTVSMTPNALDHIEVQVSSATPAERHGDPVTVVGYDASNGNLGDETSVATLAITPDGTCDPFSCQALEPGSHVVTATIGSLSASTNIDVQALPVAQLEVSLQSGTTLSPGVASTFKAIAVAPDGTVLDDVTTQATFHIDSGSCVANVCTPDINTNGRVWATMSTAPSLSSLAISDRLTCAVTTSGAAECGGSNNFGALGSGSISDPACATFNTCPGYLSPVVGLSSGVTQIAVGSANACAITSDGALHCWGSNASGMIGDGTGIDASAPSTPVGMGSDVQSVSINVDVACAVKADHTLWCWGDDVWSQLGIGNPSALTLCPSGIRCAATPQLVATSVSSVSVGPTDTCFVQLDGTTSCTGLNENGSLGGNAPLPDSCAYASSGFSFNYPCSFVPVQISGLSNVTQVASGSLFGCALHDAGLVACWGSNDWGNLGNGIVGGQYTTPGDVAGIGAPATSVSIDAGFYQSVCATSSNGLSCWGYAADGELGNASQPSLTDCLGTDQCSSIPLTSNVLDGGTTSVTGDFSGFCALDGTAPYCWGYEGLRTGSPDSLLVPTPALRPFGDATFAVLAPPQTPTSPYFMAHPNSTVLTVNWSPTFDHQGNAATSYDVQLSSDLGATWQNLCTTASLTCDTAPLQKGASYEARVRASNSYGTSDWSFASDPFLIDTVPNAPRSVSVRLNSSATSIHVSWKAPTPNGGSAIEYYNVTATPGNQVCVVGATTNFCDLTKLKAKTLFTISVTAQNTMGTGPAATSAFPYYSASATSMHAVAVPRVVAVGSPSTIVVFGARPGSTAHVTSSSTSLSCVVGGDHQCAVYFTPMTHGVSTFSVSDSGVRTSVKVYAPSVTAPSTASVGSSIPVSIASAPPSSSVAVSATEGGSAVALTTTTGSNGRATLSLPMNVAGNITVSVKVDGVSLGTVTVVVS